jgi:hypothetical protein
MQTEVYKIARTVRRELRGLIKYHKNYFYPDYTCACAVSSWVLFKTLKELGYKPKFAVGTYSGCQHAFVTLSGNVIDITASQFGLKPVTIAPLRNSKWRVWTVGNEAKLQLQSWPPEQNPFWWGNNLQKISNRCVEKLKSLGSKAI